MSYVQYGRCSKLWKRKKHEVHDWELRDLKHEKSYHQEKNKVQAEDLLKESKEPCCYLLRHCLKEDGYKLSVKGNSRGKSVFEHYNLLIKQNGSRNTYQVKNLGGVFDDLPTLLAYYKDHPIGSKMKNIGVPLLSIRHTEASKPSVSKVSHNYWIST